GLLGLAMRGSERFRRLPGLLRFAAGVAARRGLGGVSRDCFLRDRPPAFSSRSGTPFDEATSAATSSTASGTSPSTPSAVTMIECGSPSGPPPFRPRASSVFFPPVPSEPTPSRRAPVRARGFGVFPPAGPQRGHPLQLLLQLRDRQLPALQTVARLDDLLDVQLEDVPSAILAVRPLAPANERPQASAALAQGQGDLFADLVVVGDRFLGLARERDPDRGHMDEDHHGAGGSRPPRPRDPVVAPRGFQHRPVARAGRLLVEQRDAVGVADDARQLVIALLLLALGKRHRFLLRA